LVVCVVADRRVLASYIRYMRYLTIINVLDLVPWNLFKLLPRLFQLDRRISQVLRLLIVAKIVKGAMRVCVRDVLLLYWLKGLVANLSSAVLSRVNHVLTGVLV
jgi:hypothetical protein